MTLVHAPRRPAYNVFHTPDFLGTLSQRSQLVLPSTCGLMTRAMRLCRSTGVPFRLSKTYPSFGLPHFWCQSTSGIFTWSMSGRDATDSGVFGTYTVPRTKERRHMTS